MAQLLRLFKWTQDQISHQLVTTVKSLQEALDAIKYILSYPMFLGWTPLLSLIYLPFPSLTFPTAFPQLSFPVYFASFLVRCCLCMELKEKAHMQWKLMYGEETVRQHAPPAGCTHTESDSNI